MTWYPFPNVPVVAAAKIKLYAIIGAVFLAVLITASVGAWFMGKQDQKDAQASKDVVTLTDALKQATKELKQQQTTLAAAMKENAAAQERQTAIAERTEMQFQQQEKLSNELKTNLELALQSRRDLDAVRVGNNILCDWNRATTDASAGRAVGIASTAALPGCVPAKPLPGATTGSERRGQQPASKPAAQRKDGKPVPNKTPRPD